MQTQSNAPIERVYARVERRLIEDIWKFERKIFTPTWGRPATVPVPVPVPAEPEKDLGQDLANLYVEETLEEMDMGDIDQEAATQFRLGKRQFIAVVAILMLLACSAAFMATFVDIRSLPHNVVKHLY